MDVSIIIVNYNTKQLLADCLATVFEKTKDVAFEVIVVDNASTDGSEEYIKEHYPCVKWINSGENLGFGRANNLGAKYASGKYLFLLNSDTLLLNNAIRIFFDYAESHQHEGIGTLGSWLLDKNEKPNNSFGFFPCPKNEIGYLLGKYQLPSLSDITEEKEVDYITGADLFIEKRLFDKLDGFDKNIFMYYEETDLQYRLAQRGLSRKIIPGPRIIHLEGGSFENKGLSLKRFLMAQTSYNYYLRKNFHGLNYFFNHVMLCLIRLTLFITTKWTVSEKIKAYYLVLSGK